MVQYFSGKVEWLTNQLKDWGDGKPSKTSFSFFPKDDETRRNIAKTGIKNGIKENENGFYYRFYRSKPFDVIYQDKPWTGEPMIGNGSEVTIRLETTEKVNRKGNRYVMSDVSAIRIDKLVPYELPKEEKASGFPSGSPSSASAATNDKIPF